MTSSPFQPTYSVLPYSKKLGLFPAKMPLDELHWPLGMPDRLKGRQLRDLDPRDHLILYPKTAHHYRPGFGTSARVSLMVVEPGILHEHHLRRLRRSHSRFHRVMLYHEPYYDHFPNGVFFPFGTTWVPHWRELDLSKSRMCSLIASAKRDHQGHKMRHILADWITEQGLDVDMLGGGYKPFGEKHEGLAKYRFSVVIENVTEKNYFTEKLIDSILCDTVPIYWGCPNIEDFIDTEGMIVCKSEQELRAAIASLSEDLYEELLPALRAAKPQAESWCDIELRAAKVLKNSDKQS